MSWYKRVQAQARSNGQVQPYDLAIPTSPTLTRILKALAQSGRRALIVGGAVRDAVTGSVPKDIDIEVYNTTYEDLVNILKDFGRVDLVGKSFGVIKFTDPQGNDYDFSVPRRDNKTGLGHRDFETTFDPTIQPQDAAARRDFTINSLAFDPVSGELHDYYGGMEDLKNGVLRATSPAFAEDPLRVLRGMQFASRFGMDLDPSTAKVSRDILDHYKHLPKERVYEEWMKWATKGKYPSRALQYLFDTGWADHFPEIKALRGVPQDPEWHPEGDVDVHTAHVVDAAAEIARREGLEGNDRAKLMFSALSHDFAKPATTELREKGGRMRWTAHGHEKAGGPLAKQFLTNIGVQHMNSDVVNSVVPLVENHLAHANPLDARAIRRLALRLRPASIQQLVHLIEADHSGRPPLPKGLPQAAMRMRDLAHEHQVTERPPSPHVLGRHVMPYFGGKGGPHIGEVTRAAFDAQMDGAFGDEASGQEWLRQYMASRPNAEQPQG